MSKALLLIAGIISIIFSFFIGFGYGLYSLIIGIVLIMISTHSEKDLAYYKGMVLFLGVLLLVLNFLCAILVFIAYTRIKVKADFEVPADKHILPREENSEVSLKKLEPTKTVKRKVIKETIDPEIKRIDILLKLGLAMVLISGILFATTNWEYITDFIKVILLLLLSGLFFGLFVFSEKKLKLKNTTFAYWVLGFGFLNFAWIATCHFGLISYWFSYAGLGSNLVYSITFLLIGISSLITERKFPSNNISFIKYLSFYISAYSFISFLEINILLNLSILTFITFVINVCLKEKECLLRNFAGILSYLIWIPLLYNINDNIYFTIASIVNIMNLVFLSIDNNDPIESFIIPIVTNILLVISVSVLNIIISNTLLLVIIISALSLLLKVLNKHFSKIMINANQMIYLIIILSALVVNLILNPLEALLISIIYLIVNIIYSLDESNKVYNFLQPFAIYFVVRSFCVYLSTNLFLELPNYIELGILVLTYLLLSRIPKNQKIKDKYYFALMTITVIGFISNLAINDGISALIILLVTVYSFLMTPRESKDSNLLFVFLIYNIYVTIANTSLVCESILINNIIILVVYALIAYLVRKEKLLKTITYIAIILPLSNLLNYSDIYYEWHLISSSLLQLYILFLIVGCLMKDKDLKNIFSTLGIIFIMLQVIFNSSLIIALYVGIFGILLAIFGFYKKEYKFLFGLGIIITIVNIIYQLRGLWSRIPFWLYLLVFGLSLIVFVMIREVKKLDNSSNNKK